eukprot:1142210-Pelagomonas_calceolata.AAC.5
MVHSPAAEATYKGFTQGNLNLHDRAKDNTVTNAEVRWLVWGVGKAIDGGAEDMAGYHPFDM